MNAAVPPELPGARRRRWLLWGLGFCLVLFAGLLGRGCAVDNRRFEARLQLQHAKNIAEIEQVLGPPLEEWARSDHIYQEAAQLGIYTQADEQAGYVLKRYLLWSEVLTFHPGFLDLFVKVRPSDGAVLAAKVHHE